MTKLIEGKDTMIAKWNSGLQSLAIEEKRRGLAFTVIFAIVVIALAACGGADPVPPTPVPPVPTATSVPLTTPVPLVTNDRVDVGGYLIRYSCKGEGSPTVVFDSSFGQPGFQWAPVRSVMPSNIRACVYDRAGIGVSEPGPEPRNSLQIARELHTLLQNAEIDPPFVLVGIFFGTLNIRAYASMYPDEVIGMVFVDGIHPDWESRVLEQVSPEQREEFLQFINNNPENIDILENNALVKDTGPFGDMPLAVLSRSKPPSDFNRYYGIDIEEEVALNLEKIWQELQVELAALSSQSTHLNLNSDFRLIAGQPELIRDTIMDVVEKARQ